MQQNEWLEADGLGGFASGTVSGIRTRRYHALLLTATKPPSGRFVLVNGFDASVKTASGTYALSSQLYPSDVMHPDGAKRIVKFTSEPWPKWIFALEDGTKVEQEIEAWLRVRNGSSNAKRKARCRFLARLKEHMNRAGLGHVSEIADAEAPHTPRGCPFQAWSLAAVLRLEQSVLG